MLWFGHEEFMSPEQNNLFQSQDQILAGNIEPDNFVDDQLRQSGNRKDKIESYFSRLNYVYRR